jgi:hypothetical protein
MPHPTPSKTHAELKKQIIQTGYRALAKAMHPDTGGTDEEFVELREAYAELTESAKTAQPAKPGTAPQNGIRLFLDISHISTLLTGRSVAWIDPGSGYSVELVLNAGPSALVADVVKNLLDRKFGGRKK